MSDMIEMENKELPDGWRWMRLDEVCEINPSRKDKTDFDNDMPLTFVPMPAVDEVTGSLKRLFIKTYGEVKKGYTWFIDGDVLWAKITPCMENGKAFVASNLINGVGFGSTEFHVLRSKEETIPEWVWLYVRQESFRQLAANHFTGVVGQQRVPESFLREQIIPLPPLSEQRRIAAILTEQMAAVDKARAAVEEQVAAAEQLPAAYLREVFESEAAEEWKTVRLGDHALKIGSGITPRGGQSVYRNSGIPLIRSQNVHLNRFVHDRLAFISKEQDAEMEATRVQSGDVLLNITGASIGRVCVVPDDLCPANVNQHVAIIRVDETFNPEFLSFLISQPQFQKSIMESQAGATRQALTKAIIQDFEVPCPPLSQQIYLAKYLREKISGSEETSATLHSQIEIVNQLPAAILRRAFSGEL